MGPRDAISCESVLLAGTAWAVEIGDSVRVLRRTELKVEQRSLGFIEPGTTVKVEKINGDWLWLTHQGKQGWVARGDLFTPPPILDDLLAKDPTNPGLHQMRGLILLTYNQLDAALRSFDEAVRLAPNDASAYNCRGIAWYQKKKYDEAIADFDQALRLDPQYIDATRNRGSCWFAKSDYDRAIADYDEALHLSPDHAEIYSNRGDVWRARRQYDKALADYDEALRRNPKNA